MENTHVYCISSKKYAMSTDNVLRKSERNKWKEANEEKKYALPPPLQVSERAKSTSTPAKSASKEEQLDRTIEELEKSI